MANERAKALAAQQREERKALRAKKRNSDNPRDWGTMRQLREAWKMTYEHDKKLPLYVFGAWGLVIVVSVILAAILVATTGAKTWWIWGPIFGVLMGMSAAMWVFTVRMKKATYVKYEGQPGAGEVALSMLNKKKYTYTAAIAFNRSQDVIHRVIGPCGLVLIGDGHSARTKQLLNNERRRHAAIGYNIEVQTLMIGDGDGEIPLDQLAKHIQRMPKTLDKVQIDDLKSRLKALDAVKQRLPIPKGPMPSPKGMRRALRGR